MRNDQNKPRKTVERYKADKKECESEEDWGKLKEEIENDHFLTRNEKTLLIKYN